VVRECRSFSNSRSAGAHCIVGRNGNAQQESSAHHGKTFLSPDREFQFIYPSEFKLCSKHEMKACLTSYIPVCADDSDACVTYPSAFRTSTFESAGFQVREITSGVYPPTTADKCVTPAPVVQNGIVQPWTDFLISAEHPVEEIGGVSFVHGISVGVAMSHALSADVYRALHKGRCFELSITATETNPDAFDPPRKILNAAERKKVQNAMSEMLHSFRFAK
jgi:hypothetical protein